MKNISQHSLNWSFQTKTWLDSLTLCFLVGAWHWVKKKNRPHNLWNG